MDIILSQATKSPFTCHNLGTLKSLSGFSSRGKNLNYSAKKYVFEYSISLLII